MSKNTTANTQKKSWIDGFVTMVESVCNKLPPPAILFLYLFVIVAVIGAVVSLAGVALINPATNEAVTANNFFSVDGLHWILNNLVKNFTGYAPLGLVITMTLGIGLCDEAGLVATLIRNSLKDISPVLVPYVVAFIGTLGNIASDTATIIVPQVAGLVYLGVGKHPISGLIVGYLGANAGFTANLFIAGTDSLVQGITNSAIQGFIPDTTFSVDVTCNWFFMIASTFLCTAVIGYFSTKLIDPRFPKYEGGAGNDLEEVTDVQKKGLRNAGIVALLYIALLLIGFFTGPLAGENGAFLGSPFLSGLIPLLFVFFTLCGLTYGLTTGSIKNVNDVNKMWTKQMSMMGAYVLFCFCAGQFNGIFSWTKLGTMLAIFGADTLEAIGFTGIPLCIAFVIVCVLVNVFMTSSSAKWAVFAPIFVPMFMLLGYHPAFAQLLYRLGDSPGNAFSPMSPYIWMVLANAQNKYDPDIKIGTLVGNLLPTALILQVFWIVLMVIWMLLNLPIGPGVGMYLPAGIL